MLACKEREASLTRTPTNWGRWGPDDEVGALNLIGPEQVSKAAALVTEGRVIRLGQDLGPDTVSSPHRKPVERFMTRDGGDYAAGARRPNGFQFAEEVVSFASHTGTHVDALSHAWYEDQLYNGFSSSEVRSTTGAQRCGAEKLRPIATRGVFLDLVARHSGPLERGHSISADDLMQASQSEGISLQPGDVVLIYTGWFTTAGSGASTYFSGEPGIDVSAARWLAASGVSAVGADNYAVEVQPSSIDTTFPVHQFLIRDCGIPLIENLVLEELASCGCYVFFFVAAPLPIVGGTAGPVCPVAIF